jgi:hypothetical protein
MKVGKFDPTCGFASADQIRGRENHKSSGVLFRNRSDNSQRSLPGAPAPQRVLYSFVGSDCAHCVRSDGHGFDLARIPTVAPP